MVYGHVALYYSVSLHFKQQCYTTNDRVLIKLRKLPGFMIDLSLRRDGLIFFFYINKGVNGTIDAGLNYNWIFLVYKLLVEVGDTNSKVVQIPKQGGVSMGG